VFSGYPILREFFFNKGSAIRTVNGKTMYANASDYSQQYFESLGNGPVSRCANIYNAASEAAEWASDPAMQPGTCCSPDLFEPSYDYYDTSSQAQKLGLVQFSQIAEYSICQNPNFCDPSGLGTGKCCGSCLPYYFDLQAKAAGASSMQTGTPNIESDPAELMSQKVQAQTWGDGLAECVAEGTVTEDTKQCSASQAVYSKKLKDELPRMFSCDPAGSMQVDSDCVGVGTFTLA
jgi:hypothetical protein